MRHTKMIAILLGASGLLGMMDSGTVLAQDMAKERIVKIVAKRFSYSPNEIVLKKGQPVVLEFTSLDFMHGFKIPDLNIRADLPPGKVTKVHITPEKSGVYDFLCDNFCGSGHEEMSGRIIVKG
ncbi:MAG: cupredoxin domain-containing protein [Gallionellaceae bacterium]|jgi:cytochrome c oxidase subunit 2